MYNMRHLSFQSAFQNSDESAIRSGKIKLQLIGFSHQRIVAVEDIVHTLTVLPLFHLEGLREIIYSPKPEYRLLREEGFKLERKRAEFIQGQRSIVIYNFDHAELFWHIIFHEIAHYVFYLIISSRVKKRWVTEIHPHSHCVTSYGAVSASEDFAESYACYVRNPEYMNLFPEKFEFMRDFVFSGSPATLKERNVS